MHTLNHPDNMIGKPMDQTVKAAGGSKSAPKMMAKPDMKPMDPVMHKTMHPADGKPAFGGNPAPLFKKGKK